jgi:hypothetical protein
LSADVGAAAVSDRSVDDDELAMVDVHRVQVERLADLACDRPKA